MNLRSFALATPGLFSLAPLAASIALQAGCSDPVGDKARAVVTDPAPAAAPAPETPATEAAKPEAGRLEYAIRTEGSTLGFVGAKVTGTHEGNFPSFRGKVSMAGDDLASTQVSVEIDTASVVSDNERLTGHLKSPDFFDVAQFPTATFSSTSVTAQPDGSYMVTGNLSLHGVTKQISFPAKITRTEGTVTTDAEFGLNRKDFGIVYPGKPDDLIRDDVLMKLRIVAAK